MESLLTITIILALFGGHLTIAAPSKVKPIPYRSKGADNSRNLQIINGVPAKLGQFPFHAGIKIYSATAFSLCGGALITNGTVLTAAHCVEGVPANRTSPITLVMNTLDLDGTTPGAITVEASGFLSHPGFLGSQSELDNDIALIYLKTPVTTITPAKLPCANSKYDGANAQVAGYGTTEKGSTTDQLLTTNLTVLSNAACSKLQGSINNLKICAAAVGTDICLGDSGGSLTVNGTSIGIVSYTYNNCNNYPILSSVFTRVSSFRTWIDANKRYL